MVVLTFKDVGQGDSILLSWNEKDKRCIGIIDCNKYGSTNPILEEISDYEDEFEIRFIILSHGHKDHYSGILELLNYCKLNGLIIQQFISTLSVFRFQYFESTLSKGEHKSITKLIKKITEFYEVDEIILDVFPAYNKVINFKIENYRFECVYPRQKDYNILGHNLDKFIKGKIKTKPSLNYISTIFKLVDENYYILLTSDCLIESLNYVSRIDNEIGEKILKIGQAPHHGSINNHNSQFWQKRKKIENCPIVFSVGTSMHNLPNEDVVISFKEMGYQIHSTNYVNGIKAYVEEDIIQKDYSYLLDSFSILGDESISKKSDRLRGDKIFKL